MRFTLCTGFSGRKANDRVTKYIEHMSLFADARKIVHTSIHKLVLLRH